MDCVNSDINATLKCLPTKNVTGVQLIRFERDLNVLGYKLCKSGESLPNGKFDSLKEKCMKEIEKPCGNIKIKAHHYLKDIEKQDVTLIHFIPKYTIDLNYYEITKNGFNDLFYNCGGIIGMYFGWSVMSIVTLISMLNLFIKKFYLSVVFIIKALKNVLIRILVFMYFKLIELILVAIHFLKNVFIMLCKVFNQVMQGGVQNQV